MGLESFENEQGLTELLVYTEPLKGLMLLEES